VEGFFSGEMSPRECEQLLRVVAEMPLVCIKSVRVRRLGEDGWTTVASPDGANAGNKRTTPVALLEPCQASYEVQLVTALSRGTDKNLVVHTRATAQKSKAYTWSIVLSPRERMDVLAFKRVSHMSSTSTTLQFTIDSTIIRESLTVTVLSDVIAGIECSYDFDMYLHG